MANDIVVNSPYDGREVGRCPASTAADVDRAVGVAREALRAGGLPQWQRAEILETAARLISERTDSYARVIAGEAAKPVTTARAEAERAVGTFTYAAVAARTLTGELVPLEGTRVGAGKLGFTLRVPIGVVGAITPFNFPLNLVAHKVAPAIAAGCPVVLKPASQTPLSAVALRALLVDECGLPAEFLQIVAGPGGEIGVPLSEHPDVAYVTFTGSPEVGWELRRRAFRKKVGLELGNNAPVIVEPDADLARAAAAVTAGGFGYSGQSCISTQRVYVHGDVVDAFVGELVPRVEALVVGDPMDDDTSVSALIDRAARDRVEAWIGEAVAGGAELLCGGKYEGNVVSPTVLST